MKKFIVVILIVSSLFAGSLARTIAVLTKNIHPVDDITHDTENRELSRQKRQFGFGPYGQSSAQANANAFANHFGPDGFGSSNSLAGAQSFQSQGPLASFGASAANSGSQGFNCGYRGCSGNAGFSGSQSYNLPNGRKVAIAYGNGFNFAPGQAPNFSNSNSISYT